MIERVQPAGDPESALRDAGLDPRWWSAEPYAHFATHSHPRAKRLFVVRGSVMFNDMTLEAPAGIRISAGFEHHAHAGRDGVECVEAFE
jgi:hypothetical protein